MTKKQPIAVLIIGGGAAGLMAAAYAAETFHKKGYEARVAVAERGPRVGKKLLATGNGRCNLTNMGAVPRSYFGAGEDFTAPALQRFGPKWTLRIFEDMGLLTAEEGEGRVYPACMQASAVLDVLRLRCAALGVEEICGFQVASIERQGEGFAVRSSEGETLYAARVILAAGGKAFPSSGSDGSGLSLLHMLGHRMTETYPALAPLKTDPSLCRPLKGVRARAEVKLLKNGKEVKREAGEVQFADYGLSGIAVMNLSRFVFGGKQKGFEISLDLVGDVQIKDMLKRRRILNGTEPASGVLTGIVHKRLGGEIVKRAGGAGRMVRELSDGDIGGIARLCSDLRFPVTGVNGWQAAQVTAGGADTAQFFAHDMQSRLHRGLYAAGEVLDVDGPCGGYNLQWAWGSGALAGEAAACSLFEKGGKGKKR